MSDLQVGSQADASNPRCRHLKDPAVRTVAGLRSGLLQTRGLLGSAAYEPSFYGSCRLQLSSISAILASLEALATRIATLESLHEGKSAYRIPRKSAKAT